jgi:hypothetical protein
MANPPPEVKLSNLCKVRTVKGAHRWLNDELGVPVPLHYVRQAVLSGKLKHSKVGNACMFSTYDLYNWAYELVKVKTA